ncbi:toxin TcdB middle/N-terminal domain-containing protein [Candidatus Poribacteria bacterium]
MLAIAMQFLPAVIADDAYKPYLHKATVPEHPKLKLYGSYTTNLFPGAATYSYSFEVPKGTNGLSPVLAITYNSQSIKQRPGILGAGWSLTSNYIYRDVNSTPANSSDDEFKLFLNGNFHELVYDSSDGYYHTKIESYLRVENKTGASNTYGNYWLITSKDGTKYRFGYNSDSELTSNQGKNYAVKWSLEQVEDTHGNKISYSYLENPHSGDAGAVYPYRIIYNNDQRRKIEFVYESSTRPDQRRVYEQGNLVEERRRVSRIEVYADNYLVRSYSFQYVLLNPALSSISGVELYGSDNSSLLHQASFDYHITESGYKNYSTKWLPPALFSNDTAVDSGVRLVDLNNDGFVDLVKGRQAVGEKKAWINNKDDNWTLTNGFAPSMYVVDGSDVDTGVRFVDLNSDGFIDILQASNNGGVTQKAYLNNGSGWIDTSSTWDTPSNFYFMNSSKDTGARILDFNGDGKPDLIRADSNNNVKQAYMNNGSGWTDVSSSWPATEYFVNDGTNQGTRVVDVNGDGLPDILRASNLGSLVKSAWLNNGTGWVNATSTWQLPVVFTTSSKLDNGARLADLNGDGLPDLLWDYANGTDENKSAWLNNGHGWTENSSWISPEAFTKDGDNIGRRLADVDGDGFVDILVAYGNGSTEFYYTWLKNLTIPYMLKKVTNEYGGLTHINYTSSTSFDNLNSSGISQIGFNLWIVREVLVNNSLNGSFGVFGNTSYNYSSGKYDYKQMEFRGFAQVSEKLPDNSTVKHYFHQDDARKGREHRTEVYDSSNSIYAKQEKGFSYIANSGYYKVYLHSEASYTHDGYASDPTISNVSYAYDAYGNVLYKDSHGDVDLKWDEKYERYLYANNTAEWIVKISKYSLYGSDNSTLVKQTEYAYDNLGVGVVPTIGDLTWIREWNDGGEDPITSFEYDDYGNLIEKTNPLGQTTKYLYGLRDTTYTYADRVTNSLGHRTDYQYSLGTGNLLWEERDNIKREYTYDIYGRIETEILPHDSKSIPTKRYAYIFDGASPEIIKISLRETGDDTADMYYYYDGFANLVQLKTEIEDNNSVVKNIFYDGQGRVAEEQNPYFDSFSTNLSTSSPTVNRTFYTYDALSRVTGVTNPDGTEKTVAFDRWTVSDYDENSNRHDYVLDAHGRITNVLEYNINRFARNREDVYNTSYGYDTRDNLIKITDDQGNEFKFSYDSLGRKTKLVDPDLGTWTYAYDTAGNLIEQNDSIGNVITLAYDAINRITSKNSSNVNISFAYDNQYLGTLSNITMGDIKYKYSYDKRLRPTKEEVNLDGNWITTGMSYDSMDRLVEKRLPSTDLEYIYNRQGKVQKITGFITDANFNAVGSLANRTYSNNLISKFTYDSENNRLNQITTGALQQLDYTYDNVGNIDSITDAVNSRNYTMSYDGLDRLANTTINSDIYQYEYDSIGNIKRIVRDNTAKRLIYNGRLAHAPSQIIDFTPGAGVYNAQDLDSGNRNRTIEFFLINEGSSNLIDVNWSVNFGPNTVDSTVSFNLSNEQIMVIVQNNYSSGGSYDSNISTSWDANPFEDGFGVKAQSLELLGSNMTESYMEFIFENHVSESATGVEWNCPNGVVSTLPFNISGNSGAMAIIAYNYSSPGYKTVLCNVSSNDGSGNRTTDFELNGLEILNYSLTHLDTDSKRVKFFIKNHYYPLTVTWQIKSDGQTFSDPISMGTGNVTAISQIINYTTDGEKIVNITVSSGSIKDTYQDQFTINAFGIERYFRYSFNTTERIISFDLLNNWPSNLSVSWNISNPSLANSTNLDQDESLMIIIEENYTQGRKEPTISASSGAMSGTFTDWFDIYIVHLLDLQSLSESVASTITEIIARSNSGSRTVSWNLDTGKENVTASDTTTINESSGVMVIIEHSYASSAVYLTNATVNDSTYEDHAAGVAIP